MTSNDRGRRQRLAPHWLAWLAGVLWLVSPPLPAADAGSGILVLGDSISAGHGIAVERGWVNLLRQRLQQRHIPATVINASISGETSDGGRARLPELLARYHPGVVILELGGNDGLRGFQTRILCDNLAAMVQLSRRAGARVLLLGMKIPPNYGPRYTADFYRCYTDLAHTRKVPLVPFLLKGVATAPDLMQDDGIHPNAAAQPRLLDNVWPRLEPLLPAVSG